VQATKNSARPLRSDPRSESSQRTGACSATVQQRVVIIRPMVFAARSRSCEKRKLAET